MIPFNMIWMLRRGCEDSLYSCCLLILLLAGTHSAPWGHHVEQCWEGRLSWSLGPFAAQNRRRDKGRKWLQNLVPKMMAARIHFGSSQDYVNWPSWIGFPSHLAILPTWALLAHTTHLTAVPSLNKQHSGILSAYS